MTKTNLLRAKIAEKGYTITTFAEKLGKNKSTISPKVNNKTKFSQDEIKDIKIVLDLTDRETIEIFFED